MDDHTKIAEVLDRHQPGWEIEWATGDELRYTLQLLQTNARDVARARLKRSVSQRVFHRVLNAALEAGVIELPQPTALPADPLK